MAYPIYEFGGDGPPINVALANGFPPEVYRPLLEPLTTRYRVVCLLPRALWEQPGPAHAVTSWRQVAADLLAGLRVHNLTGVIALGHSMGGVASMLAVLQEPGRFRGLAMLDPTILPPFALTSIGIMARLGLQDRFPLVQGALRRRARFISTEEAYRYWASKRLFANWPEETVHLYADGLTRPNPEGGGVTLRWPPAWEAQYYRTIMTDSWREAARLRGLLPTLVVGGQHTDTFSAKPARRMRRLLPEATHATIAGHGHLFPMSAPSETRAVLEDWLAGLEEEA